MCFVAEIYAELFVRENAHVREFLGKTLFLFGFQKLDIDRIYETNAVTRVNGGFVEFCGFDLVLIKPERRERFLDCVLGVCGI